VGGFPRKKGMERKDLIAKNTTIFSAQGRALQKVGSRASQAAAGRGTTACTTDRLD